LECRVEAASHTRTLHCGADISLPSGLSITHAI
jgi:hypothetical protein